MEHVKTETAQIREWANQFTNPTVRARAAQIADRHVTMNAHTFAKFKEEAEPELRKLLGLKSTIPEPISRDAFRLMSPREQRDHCLAGGKITE
jgi:hypothetical protein